MAKSKSKKKTTKRRHKVGALSFNANSPLVKYGSLALGFVLANKINPKIDELTKGKVDDKVLAGASVGLGGYYLFLHKGKKNLPLAIAAGVVAGAGVKRGMDSLKVGGVGGYGQVPVLGSRRRVGGYQSVPVLGNTSSMNGYGPEGSIGAYMVNPKPQNVMAGVDGGSGITNSGGGGCMG